MKQRTLIVLLVMVLMLTLAGASLAQGNARPNGLTYSGTVVLHKNSDDAITGADANTNVLVTCMGQHHLHLYGFDRDSRVRIYIYTPGMNPPNHSWMQTIVVDGNGDYLFPINLNEPGLWTYEWEVMGTVPAGQREMGQVLVAEVCDEFTDTPVLPEVRTSVSVRCHGCWGNTATLWIGGTEQLPTLPLVADTQDVPAAHYILWHQVPWEVTARVSLPEGLDPERWKLAVWQSGELEWADELTRTAIPGSTVRFEFQLIDTAGWDYGE